MRREKARSVEAIEDAARHCLPNLPYRMIVFSRVDGQGVPLYLVAGSAKEARGAAKALRLAFETHGGTCFYCKKKPGNNFTVDHVECVAWGGPNSLQNLVIACEPCNQHKGQQPIEAFNPEAGRAWLEALLMQVEDRLAKLTPPSRPPPKQAAAGGP
jgi:5-methylcytosine-specific restriction endonuclease McrA